MATFNDFVTALQPALSDFAQSTWKAYKDAAIKDGNAFVEKSKADLERWTKSLANGHLSEDDFKWLIVGKKDLAELVALKQAGLAQVALDKFVSGLIDTVVSTAFKVFL